MAAGRYQGLVYRGHNPKWHHKPLSGDGAARHGGRFNPAGTPALYVSERFETAWLEAQQGFPYKTQPLTLCTYEVDCQSILDLTEPGNLSDLGLSPSDLYCPWLLQARRGVQPLSWWVSESLMAEGIAGIRVPSFAVGAGPRDINLVFWKWSPGRPYKVDLVDDEQRLAARK